MTADDQRPPGHGRRSRRRTFPARWPGAVGGFLGVLPLLPIAARLAERIAAPPLLPGLERTYRDVKEATYAEALVILLLAPAAAFFFAVVLPGWLTRLAPAGDLSLEWPAAGFASSLFFARHGTPAGYALAIGVFSAAAIGFAVFAFRRRIRVRRLFTMRARGIWPILLAASAAISVAVWSRLPTPPAAAPDVTARIALTTAAIVAAAGAGLARSRRPRALLPRLRRSCAVVVAAAAVGLAIRQPRLILLGPTVVGVAAATFRAGRQDAPFRAALAAFAVVCAWRLLVRGAPSLEVFEEGHSLAPAQRYLAGAVPYVGVLPVHGWGADGGVDTFVMRTFGPTLDAFQARSAVWTVIALLALGAASFAAFRSAFWGGVALLFALSICASGLFERQMLAFASLACLVAGARRRSRAAWYPAAGGLAGLEMLHTVEYGLIVLLGGAAAISLLAIAHDETATRIGRFDDLWLFLAGASASTAPFLMRLAALGGLRAFLHESFVATPRWVAQAWGLPAGSIWGSLSQATDDAGVVAILAGRGVAAFFALSVIAVSAAVLLVRSASSGLDADDRAALAALCVALVATRVVLGRADGAHFERYAIFSAIPAAWLLVRAWRSRSGLALPVLTASLLSLRLHPLSALEASVNGIVASDASNSQPFARPPRAGRGWVPLPQAAALQAFRRFVDSAIRPGETFFDFDNQPALYFLADREPPIRYSTVAQYESAERQREVIEALEQTRPPLALLPYGLYGTLDIPNAERAPAVARYLAAHYGQPCLLGGWLIARRIDGERTDEDSGSPPPCVVPDHSTAS